MLIYTRRTKMKVGSKKSESIVHFTQRVSPIAPLSLYDIKRIKEEMYTTFHKISKRQDHYVDEGITHDYCFAFRFFQYHPTYKFQEDLHLVYVTGLNYRIPLYNQKYPELLRNHYPESNHRYLPGLYFCRNNVQALIVRATFRKFPFRRSKVSTEEKKRLKDKIPLRTLLIKLGAIKTVHYRGKFAGMWEMI